jgi:hypothetical protein
MPLFFYGQMSRVRQYDVPINKKVLNLPPPHPGACSPVHLSSFAMPINPKQKGEQSIKIIPLLCIFAMLSLIVLVPCIALLCFTWLYATYFCYMDFLGINKIANHFLLVALIANVLMYSLTV